MWQTGGAIQQAVPGWITHTRDDGLAPSNRDKAANSAENCSQRLKTCTALSELFIRAMCGITAHTVKTTLHPESNRSSILRELQTLRQERKARQETVLGRFFECREL